MRSHLVSLFFEPPLAAVCVARSGCSGVGRVERVLGGWCPEGPEIKEVSKLASKPPSTPEIFHQSNMVPPRFSIGVNVSTPPSVSTDTVYEFHVFHDTMEFAVTLLAPMLGANTSCPAVCSAVPGGFFFE